MRRNRDTLIYAVPSLAAAVLCGCQVSIRPTDSALAPTALTLTPDTALIVARQSNASPLANTTDTWSLASTVGTTTTSLAAASTSVQAVTQSLLTPTAATVAALSSHLPFSVTVDVDLRFPAAATPACAFMPPYSSLTCDLLSFRIDSSDIQADPLQLKVYASNGGANAYRLSNELPTRILQVRQISDTHEDASEPDWSSTGGQWQVVITDENYFYFYGKETGIGIWKYYRYSGTTLEKVYSNLGGNSYVSDATSLNGTLYFSAGPGELHRLSGETLTEVADTRAGGTDVVDEMYPFDGKIYFSARNSSNVEKLHVFDGTNTQEISNTRGAAASSDLPFILGSYQDRLYFSALAASGRRKLYYLSGTSIVQVSNTAGAGGDDMFMAIDTRRHAAVYDGKLYFPAANTSGALKLHVHDGSTIRQITNIRGDGSSDAVSHLTVYDGKLYFAAYDSSAYGRLYSYDGTNLVQVSKIREAATDEPSHMAVYNGLLYVNMRNADGHTKLFAYDGRNLFQVSNTAPTNDDPRYLTVFKDKLMFFSYNANGKEKLYQLCDSSAGCTID